MASDDLADEITKALMEYTDDVEDGLKEAEEDVAKEAVAKLKSTGSFKGNKYKKGWAKKKQGDGYVVYNRTGGQLTHLLEFGHAIKRGGRTVGNARAFEHIAPVDEWAADEMESRVRKAIGG